LYFHVTRGLNIRGLSDVYSKLKGRKASVKSAADRFIDSVDVISKWLNDNTSKLKDKEKYWHFDLAIIKLYSEFAEFMLKLLIAAINNDPKTFAAHKNVKFPSKIPYDVSKYLVTGDLYFDFKGRDGLIKKMNVFLPDNSPFIQAVKENKYKDSLEKLSAFRNWAAHDSEIAKSCALKLIKKSSGYQFAGSYLSAKTKTGNRLTDIGDNLKELAETIKKIAKH